jgi:hypothetical protein
MQWQQGCRRILSHDKYSACLLINHAENGKMYLYDLVDMKKEASTPLTIN